MQFRIWFSFTIFILSTSLIAQPSVKSIEWQKYELENSLKLRISDVVKQVVSKDQFFIEVHVDAKVPNVAVPSFNLPKNKRVKILQKKNKDAGTEHILFDKLGLNAPTFEGSFTQRSSDLQLKLFQYSKKIEREFISKMDLFTNIETINIKIGLDKEIDANKVSKLKELIENIVPSLAGVKPVIETFSFEFNKVKKESDSLVEKWSHLFTPAGIILATILFCITAFFLFSRYRKMTDELMAKNDESSKQESEEKEMMSMPSVDQQVDPNLRPGSAQLAEAINSSADGVERFCLYLEKSYEQATNLIKKWINLETRVSSSSIFILSESLSIEELYKVFMKLTETEKTIYKKMTSIEVTLKDKADADKFISQQVLEDIISTAAIEDEELQNLLVGISPLKAAEILISNPEDGALLINLVSAEFLTKMFHHVESDKTKELSQKAIMIKKEDFTSNIEGLKTLLKDSIVDEYRNPFISRIVEVISDLDYMRSESLLDAVIEAEQFEIAEDMARVKFPVRLIHEVPSDIVKGILKPLKVESRAELLCCLEENERLEFLDKITQEGTKGRDLLEFEMKRILDNDESYKRVQSEKNDIYGQYITLAQKFLKSNVEAREISSKIISEWLETLNRKETQIMDAA